MTGNLLKIEAKTGNFIKIYTPLLRFTLQNLTKEEAILWIWILLNAKEVNKQLISSFSLSEIKEIEEEEEIINLFNNLETKLRITVSNLYLKTLREKGIGLPLTRGRIFKFRPIKLFSIEADNIEVILSEFTLPLVEEVKTFYDKEGFKYLVKLKSKHAQNLYCFLRKYKNLTLSVGELQAILGVNYKRFRDFSQKVFYPAIEEINDETDIFVDFKFNKVGRGGKIESITFETRKKPEFQ